VFLVVPGDIDMMQVSKGKPKSNVNYKYYKR